MVRPLVVMASIDRAETDLVATIEQTEGLRRTQFALKAEADAASWAASEEAKSREEELQANATRLKEGLAKRVLRQWLLQYVARCFKSWSGYVIRRHLQRELHLPLSDNEDGDKAPSGNGLADSLSTVAASIAAIPALF